MYIRVNGVRLFFDIEGASLVPDGPVMREKPTLLLEARGHPDQASLDAWRQLVMPLYTRIPRDPDATRRAVIRPEVLQWFTRPGGESHTFNMLGDLGRIQCPTLVLGGEDDPIHPIESQADIAAALPADLVQFERFKDCRHAVVPDAPELAMAVMRDFIQRTK